MTDVEDRPGLGRRPSNHLGRLPDQQPQRQDSVTDQLNDLFIVASRFGMYDAADWLWKAWNAHVDVTARA